MCQRCGEQDRGRPANAECECVPGRVRTGAAAGPPCWLEVGANARGVTSTLTCRGLRVAGAQRVLGGRDHTQLAVHVQLPDKRVVMPWATLFLDQATRALVGWAIAVTPSQESVLAALRAAIDVDVPNGPMGGVPSAIRFDRGKEFLAAAVGSAAASLAIDAKPLPAYTPHLKGGVERINSSIEQLFLATLPGFVHGARGRDGRLVEDGPLLGLEALVELFAAFVVDYNAVRAHQGLGGRTPSAGVEHRLDTTGCGAAAPLAASAARPGCPDGHQAWCAAGRPGLQLRRVVRLGR